MKIADFYVHFGDIVKLDKQMFLPDLAGFEWRPYNPRKDIKRYGISLTSLDGEMGGVPDLDSLREYNRIHSTNFREDSFKTLTAAGKLVLKDDMSTFELGRSHLIKMEAGGYFPYHRDGGFVTPQTFRLFCPLQYSPDGLVWIQEDRVLRFDPNSVYVVNTSKVHALFAFSEQIFAVLNVLDTPENIKLLLKSLHVK